METAQREGAALDERWHLRKNGERFWAVSELMPLKDEDDASITGFVKILRDRTFKRRRDAQLRELNDTVVASEARLQMALDVGGMGVWQCDLKTRTVNWWPGMDTIHGLPADAPPLHLEEYCGLVHPDDRERVAASVRDAIANKSGGQSKWTHGPSRTRWWCVCATTARASRLKCWTRCSRRLPRSRIRPSAARVAWASGCPWWTAWCGCMAAVSTRTAKAWTRAANSSFDCRRQPGCRRHPGRAAADARQRSLGGVRWRVGDRANRPVRTRRGAARHWPA